MGHFVRAVLIKAAHWMQAIPAARDVIPRTFSVAIQGRAGGFKLDVGLDARRRGTGASRPLLFRRFDSPLELEHVASEEGRVFAPSQFSEDRQYETVGVVPTGPATPGAMRVHFRYAWHPGVDEPERRPQPWFLALPEHLYQPASLRSRSERGSVRHLPRVELRTEVPEGQVLIGGIRAESVRASVPPERPILLQGLLLAPASPASYQRVGVDRIVISPLLARNLSAEQLGALLARTREAVDFFEDLFDATPLLRLFLIHPRDGRGLLRAPTGAAVLGVPPRDALVGRGSRVGDESLATQIASFVVHPVRPCAGSFM